MPGPARKPTALRVLEGNPAKRALPKNEPRPRPVTPNPPDWMGAASKATWLRTVPELERLGTLTICDGEALAAYCIAWQEVEDSTRFIEANGMVYPVPTGFATRPEVTIRHKALMLVKSFASEFGLTPASRSKISVPGAVDDDPLGLD